MKSHLLTLTANAFSSHKGDGLVTAPVTPRLFSNLRLCAEGASLVVVLFGWLGLYGWTFGIESLKSIFAGLPVMVPNTALAFVFAGFALWLLRNETAGTAARRTGQACALAVALVGALTLAEYIFDWNPGIDQWLYADSGGSASTPVPGRMSFLTALNFLLLGLALLLLDWRSRDESRPFEVLTAAGVIISLLALIGFACSVPSFYKWGSIFSNGGMALHASIAFTVLGAGLLCARPDCGLMRIVTSPTASGTMARRLLLAPVLIPLATGLVQVLGLRTGIYNIELLSWLFAFLNIFIFTGAIWWSAGLLHRAEMVRRGAEENLHDANAALEQRVVERTADLSKAMAMAKESETRFRSLVEQSLVGIYVIQDERLVYVNPKMTEIFGYSQEELTFAPVTTVILEEDRPMAIENIRQRLEGVVGSIHYTLRNVRKDGEVIDVEVHGSRAEFNGRPAILGTLLDVTQRKQAEERLAVEHAVTAALADAAPLTDTAKRILQIICQNFHWDLGEVWTIDRTAKVMRCLEIWHPPSAQFKGFVATTRQTEFARGVGSIGSVWATGQPIWIGDLSQDLTFQRKSIAAQSGLHGAFAFPIRVRDEVLAVVTFFSAQMREPDPELLAMCATVGSQIGQFIERKKIEEQLHQAQKMEAIGTLAGGIAHDFNNILTAIVGNADLLQSELHPHSPAHESVLEIVKASDRAKDLVGRILTFSRKQEQQPRAVTRLQPILSEVASLLRASLPATIEIRQSIDADCPAVRAVPVQVHQIVMNLATNAAYAMRERGGRLEIGLERFDVDPAFARAHPPLREGHYLQLKITDTGCGMDDAVVERIFEPFFTTKPMGEGTGLGLSAVHGIMQDHNGAITVYSEPGKGTTFYLFFPVAAVATDEVVAPAKSMPAGRGQQVLYVDDEQPIANLAKVMLEKIGYSPTVCHSAEEALVTFRANPDRFDAVITDLTMPRMTGLVLAGKLRSLRPHLPIILATGYSGASDGSRASEVGIQYFLAKPFSVQTLAESLHRV